MRQARQTDGMYDGYKDGDPLMCVDCGTKDGRVDGSKHNGDAVCDACEYIRDVEEEKEEED